MKYPGYEPEPKANVDHTISGQVTGISTLDHHTKGMSVLQGRGLYPHQPKVVKVIQFDQPMQYTNIYVSHANKFKSLNLFQSSWTEIDNQIIQQNMLFPYINQDPLSQTFLFRYVYLYFFCLFTLI